MARYRARTGSTEYHETSAYLNAQGHLLDTAHAYRVLGMQLTPAGLPGGHGAPESRPAAALHVVDARATISAWATWCARAVIDHHDEIGQPWTPPTSDPAGVLRDVGKRHLGVFLADPLEAMDFLDAAAEHAAAAQRAAWPDGARWMRLHVDCTEHGTSDLGERIPCGGEYRMWMRPGQETLGDMVCDVDGEHRITPLEWQRAMRRKPVDPAAAARLVRTLRLGRVSA